MPDLRELWSYRDLLLTFARRDLKVRYKQTVLGGVWAVLQPFLLMLIFTIFFNLLGAVPTQGVPYALFIYTALLPYTYFSNTISRLGGVLLEQQAVISKVYFPRLLIPLSALIVGLVDLAIASLVLVIMMAFYGLTPPTRAWAAPFCLLPALVATFGLGLWFAALNVEYRDVQQAIPFLMQVLFFATPIFYPASLIPRNWRLVYSLNPMVGVVQSFQWSLLGKVQAPDPTVWVSLFLIIPITIGGLFYFYRVEGSFVDVA